MHCHYGHNSDYLTMLKNTHTLSASVVYILREWIWLGKMGIGWDLPNYSPDFKPHKLFVRLSCSPGNNHNIDMIENTIWLCEKKKQKKKQTKIKHVLSAGVVWMCKGFAWMGTMGIALNSRHDSPCKLIARPSRIPGYIVIMDIIDTRWQCDGSNGDCTEFTTYLFMFQDQ